MTLIAGYGDTAHLEAAPANARERLRRHDETPRVTRKPCWDTVGA